MRRGMAKASRHEAFVRALLLRAKEKYPSHEMINALRRLLLMRLQSNASSGEEGPPDGRRRFG